METGDDGRYQCGIFDQIVDAPGSEWNPAFGAGCCMPLFNEARDKILTEIKNGRSDLRP